MTNGTLTYHSTCRNDLKKNGFPPELPDEDPTAKKRSKAKKKESFVRIGSIDLSGKIVAQIKSRPLKKDLTEVKFALDAFDPLDEQIKTQSLENLAKTGRRGCTTDELYNLIQTFVGSMIKQALAETFEDVAGGGTKTFDKVDNVVKLTRKSVTNYINDAGEWSEGQIQDKLNQSLAKWGVCTNSPEGKQALSLLSKKLHKSSNSMLSKNSIFQRVLNNLFRDEDDQGEKSKN